jgi:hypothetical protein
MTNTPNAFFSIEKFVIYSIRVVIILLIVGLVNKGINSYKGFFEKVLDKIADKLSKMDNNNIVWKNISIFYITIYCK